MPISTATGRKQRASKGLEPIPKANCEPKRFVREFRTDGEEHGFEVGKIVNVAVLNEVPRVDLIGLTKGRGFTGVMKRHNFHGQCASHGVKRVHRHGGSIGASADPSRVVKGMRMAGRYGGEQVTMRNIRVFKLDEAENMVLVEGAVPGPNWRLGRDSAHEETCESSKESVIRVSSHGG